MGGTKIQYFGFTVFCDFEKVVSTFDGKCDYLMIGGREVCPSTLKLHYHGLAYSVKPKCWLTIWEPLSKDGHFEKVKNARDWYNYCAKLESKQDPDNLITLEKGLKPSKLLEKKETQEKLSNAEVLEKGLIKLVDEEKVNVLRYEGYKKSIDKYNLDTTKLVDASGVKGIWIYGEPGVGKSFSVRKKYPELFLKPQNKWWDGYAGEKVVLLDDFDCSQLSHLIKIWADAYGFRGEVKSGTVPIIYDKLIITSNYTIFGLFGDNPVLYKAIARRFKFITKESMDHDISDLI